MGGRHSRQRVCEWLGRACTSAGEASQDLCQQSHIPQNTTNSNLMHITDWLPTLAYMVNVSVADVWTDGLAGVGPLMVCSCIWTA